MILRGNVDHAAAEDIIQFSVHPGQARRYARIGTCN
jgi:hypothetical protein